MEHYNNMFLWMPKDVKSILDVGAGWGMTGLMLRETTKLERLDAIEIFSESVAILERSKLYNKVFQGDAISVLSRLADKSYDMVLCLGVIEHIPKDQHDELLRQMERVGKRVMIHTMNKFYDNPPEHPWIPGNPYQEHISLFTAKDAKTHGYHTRGQGRLFSLGVGLFKRLFVNKFPDYSAYKDCP